MSDTDPTIGEVYRLVVDIRQEQRVMRRDLFVGKASISGRLTTVEGRVRDIRTTGPRTAWWAGIGTSVGAALVVVLGYLGIRPPGQSGQ